MAHQPASRAQRALRLVDIENEAGAARLCPDVVLVAQVLLEAVSAPGPMDQCVVAVSGPDNALAAWLGWDGPARITGHWGHDGADHALLDVISDEEFITRRYDRVVICTGDGIFANAVRSLKMAGVAVEVIAPRGGTSSRLAAAAGSDITYIDRPMGPSHYATAA